MDWLESIAGDQGLTRGILTYKLPVPSVIDRLKRKRFMASSENRIRTLINENLGLDGQSLDLNLSLTDAGVSSMELVAFAKVVAREYGLTFTPQDCASLGSVRELIDFIDSRAG